MAAPTPKELLDLAVAAIQDELADGESPAGAISRLIGEPYQNVNRWIREVNGPSYGAAMRILDAFGWISIPEDVRGSAASPPDPLVGLLAGMTELLDQQKEALEILRVLQSEPQKGRAQTRPTRSKKTD